MLGTFEHLSNGKPLGVECGTNSAWEATRPSNGRVPAALPASFKDGISEAR